MNKDLAGRISLAFVLHALGGVLFFAFLLSFLLGPVDLFIHRTFLRTAVVQCMMAGGIFYGFTLPLLWRHPLSPGWGIAYAAASWLLLVVVFTPDSGGAGMMRRVADPDHYMEHQLTAQRVLFTIRLTAGAVFLLMQGVFLRAMLRPVLLPVSVEPPR